MVTCHDFSFSHGLSYFAEFCKSEFTTIELTKLIAGLSLKKMSKSQIRQSHDQKVKGSNRVMTKPWK